MAARIHRGDLVLVIKGKDRGKTGRVHAVLTKHDRLLVEGVNVAKKHMKAQQGVRQAGIIDKEIPIHSSNVKLLHEDKPTRVGFRTLADGRKVRVALRSGEVIE